MRKLLPALLFCTLTPAAGQDPVITSWILNPGTETGYGGYLTNVLGVQYNNTDVYVTCNSIPGYDIGPWNTNPNIPTAQGFTFRITRQPQLATGAFDATPLGQIGVFRNGVSIFNAKDGMSYNNQGVWERNALVFEGASFDQCLGHPGPHGDYHLHVSPNCLYDQQQTAVHSPLIGHAFDGFPIYGAFAHDQPDGSGGIVRMRSSYRMRSMAQRSSLPDGTTLQTAQYGPAIGGAYPLGAFLQDFEYVEGLGHLDAHNGRFCVTPDHPEGTYTYFVTLDEDFDPAYPYTLGPAYRGVLIAGNTGPQGGHQTIPSDAVAWTGSGTGAEEIGLGGGQDVFPNPTDGSLFVPLEQTGSVRLQVIDPHGRICFRANTTGPLATLDLQGLAAGTYLLQTEAPTEGLVTRTRFIKR